ncbi:hypothetical protein IGI39_004406 [Enterococcus sp. AZ135]
MICLVGLVTNVAPTTLASENETSQESGSPLSESVSDGSEESGNTTASSTKERTQVLPQFAGVQNKTIELNQKFDPKEGVSATEVKDGDLTDKIKITGKVDTSKVGKYALTYSVENSQGVKAEKAITINVQAKAEPKYQMTISNFSVPKNVKLSEEILKRVVIKDAENKIIDAKEIKVFVEGSQLADKLGTSAVKFSVRLPDGKILTDTVTITVISGIKIVEPKDGYTHTGSIYEDAIDFMNYIEAYEIDSEGKEKRLNTFEKASGVGIQVLKTELDISTAGKYSIVYRVTNSLGETLEHTSSVTVVKKKTDVTPPTIQADDHVLYVGDVLTKEIVLGWAKTTDADKLTFEVLDDQIPTVQLTKRLTEAGIYKIRYTASRVEESTQVELTVQKDITLTVKEKKTTVTTQNSIPTSNGTASKKAAPNTAAKAKTLPKTGSEGLNSGLIFLGAAIVGLVLFLIGKKSVKDI